MSKRVPDRWRDYKACTWNPIKNERIVAFKTPLSRKFDHVLPDDDGILESERFTPTDLVNGLAESDLHLGLVLDFTFTKRYYDPQELTDKGIEYTKMMCPGHEIPKERDVKRFEDEVHSFLDQDKTGKLVGVHCTHGVNRTGYMVCRYLIDYKGYKPEEAIEAFNEARGHPIERENYLDDLRTRALGHGSHVSHQRTNRRHNSKEREFPPRRHRDTNWRETDPPPWERESNHHGRDNYYEYDLRSHLHNPRYQPERYYDNDDMHHRHQRMYVDRPQHPSSYKSNHYHDIRGNDNRYDDNFREHERYRQRQFNEHHIVNRYPQYRGDSGPERPRRRPSQREFRR